MKQETEIKLSIFIILTLILLIIYIPYKYSDMDCSKCIINFKHARAINIYGINYNINISAIELYDNFVEDKCLIKWDRVNGFMKNG